MSTVKIEVGDNVRFIYGKVDWVVEHITAFALNGNNYILKSPHSSRRVTAWKGEIKLHIKNTNSH